MYAELNQLYEQLNLVAKDIEFAKQNFINTVRIGNSESNKITLNNLSEKCNALKNQVFDILKIIYELMESEDEG